MAVAPATALLPLRRNASAAPTTGWSSRCVPGAAGSPQPQVPPREPSGSRCPAAGTASTPATTPCPPAVPHAGPRPSAPARSRQRRCRRISRGRWPMSLVAKDPLGELGPLGAQGLQVVSGPAASRCPGERPWRGDQRAQPAEELYGRPARTTSGRRGAPGHRSVPKHTDRSPDHRTVDRSQPRPQEALLTHASVLRDPARRVMSMHIDARAARSAAPGALPRLRLPRTAWWPAVLLAAALAAAFATAPPALAAQPGVTQVSADPYTPATAPTGEHATEVEPDTFAFGSTLVSAFQTGRVFNGGATDIGWATSSHGGVSWTHRFLPGPHRGAVA